MVNIDWIIRQAVDDIWLQYDSDNSGSLDKEETRQFVYSILVTMNGADFQLDDRLFETTFRQVDVDESGMIEKDEMALLIRTLVGLVPD